MRGQVNMMDEAKPCCPIFLKCWLCNMQSSGAVMENWALSVDQCRLQALQFSVHLINLLSRLLKCNGFTGIQKAAVDQMGSRPPNSDDDLCWCKFGFGKCFGASSHSNRWAGCCQVLYKIYFWLQVTIWSINVSLFLHRIRKDDASKWQFFFFFCGQLMRHPLKFFTFLICFKCWMIVQWSMLSSSATFPVAIKRISFNDPLNWLLSTSDGPSLHFLIFKALVSFAKLLEPPLYCTFFSSS